MLTADRTLAARDLWKIQECLEQAAGPSRQDAPAELPANAPEILESCIRQIHAALARPLPAAAALLLKQSLGFMERLRQDLTPAYRDGGQSSQHNRCVLTTEQQRQYRAAGSRLEAARQSLARNLYELLEPHCGVIDSGAPAPESGQRAAAGEGKFADGLYAEHLRRQRPEQC